ncbi:universal stress protein [Cupriavidus pinatubonensis]|uniref:Universal stress protein n=1 Tax=Cupriavidus pinatubonensis TaxID=248026 RepID=A0ABM8XYU7_9BURK|nr:universal stress protein [Cupriavidus pinatubonensis]CAG9185619.1 Putative universal stress protein [Cupriavidus pinatubonensis]
MYKKILVAVDGSHASRLALLTVIDLTKGSNAEVKVIYVVDDSEALLEVAFINREDLLRNMKAYGQDILSGCGVLLKAAGVRHSVELIEKPVARGRIAQTILSRAATCNADLIALGTHGRRGVARVVMGSVAQGVVSHSIKPVLLVRSEPEDET